MQGFVCFTNISIKLMYSNISRRLSQKEMDVFLTLKIILEHFRFTFEFRQLFQSSINYYTNIYPLLFFLFLTKTTNIAPQSKFHHKRGRKSPVCFSVTTTTMSEFFASHHSTRRSCIISPRNWPLFVLVSA